ncbi:threonylcarbamoyl-AMP synthase [Pedobacter sp. BS3]|uniref:L-threonylcarbamoyladenylate synthase n=1 Tax=Pedobacter sp. BS3 TaxID=2567937 RepID=UPI0011EEC4D5|nr:L-threonylcarbamoyladenylate synthase [Pedobacter sp. BS3]TZF81320.1 threonylcarbamoyl-AMP synthase [Pedobacter sp. BS3]
MKIEIDNALKILKNGGIILYPTDTIWGIGCDATNPEAVERIYKLKGRDAGKSMIILLDTDAKLPGYVNEVPDIAYDLIEYAERPLTLIFSGAKNLAGNVIHQDGTIGIRIVKHAFCQQLIQRFKKPIVSTSANISGQPSPTSFSNIDEQIKAGVDYVVNLEQDEPATNRQPSTIMRLEPNGRFAFIRR